MISHIEIKNILQNMFKDIEKARERQLNRRGLTTEQLNLHLTIFNCIILKIYVAI